MKKQFLKLLMLGAVAMATTISGCSKNNKIPEPEENLGNSSRWITLSGALMGTTPGDGNGGTMVYSVSVNDAKDPNKSIDVYTNGFPVRSQRTARLQSSLDGSTLFNIAYTGPNGGEFSKYKVNGGSSYAELSDKVNISSYATTSPRWVKLFDNDKTGVAVNVSGVKITTEADGITYKYARAKSTVLSLNLQAAGIKTYEQYEIPLLATEEAQGFYIGRLDGPVLNKAGNKLIIGVSKSKYNTATGIADNSGTVKIPAKSLLVDYPSLKNPTLISSTVSTGNTNGYRNFNSYLAEDGYIYQATQEAGSHILRINPNNEYDNAYKFSLDAALGVKGAYIESWTYARNGIAFIMYTHDGAAASAFNATEQQSFIARVDLNAKTAKQVTLPYEPDLYFFQYQGWVVNGDEVFVAVTPVGKDGNIYIINSRTGNVTKGAKLINKTGNHYIGVF
ncbi:hypothetical protein DBR40_23485 [Pedobacter sp. KBW01]|uniref:hypothetical protein n=1 Tax=Pedobacter sp. KBW01 TaxID=2153364 RepID=UPI000F5B80A0|nr:hypothetical protein [Pedobacter sp. KBW01]RQO65516.1 hypothetical protein DBR40_23485 [Pedobacter sp. KBW01]